MTVLRTNNRPAARSFNNFVDDFFSTVPSLLSSDFAPARQVVPVNITETENGYLLELSAPGLQKESFNIRLDDSILTVEAEKKTEEENKTAKQLRREYRLQSFKRSFTLDENIDAEGITAQYVNGILTLNLPRKGDVKPSTKQITIQ